MIILIILIAVLTPFLIMALIFNVRIDWTKEKRLLLWYDEYDINQKEDSRPVRKFITLFKL